MSVSINLCLTPKQSANSDYIKRSVAAELHVATDSVSAFRILRKSIDARQREPKILLTIEAFTDGETITNSYSKPEYHDVHNARHEVIVVGSGPAGLFAALRLLELGIKPIILERGRDVSNRKVDIAQLCRNNGLNSNSNYCFGEGGAGTFSDGKLYSRSNKRGNIHRVMEIFHFHGADDSILYEAHPHIGSDRLPLIIKSMRQTIIDCGGEFFFQSRVDSLIIENSEVKGCVVCDLSQSLSYTLTADAVILAIGHSAHDTYRMLDAAGVDLQTKGFALGVRVEHQQSLIDRLMYHGTPRGNYLPAASYSLVTQVDGRGVYSFCMCPGGHIVPASSQQQSCVVNGMSTSKRASAYANSGIVVEIQPDDIPAEYHGAIGALEYQEYIERLAYQHANAQGAFTQHAPAQRLRDFVEGKESNTLPPCSYIPGIVASRLDLWLPPMISKRLQQGFRDFDRKYHGFLTNYIKI